MKKILLLISFLFVFSSVLFSKSIDSLTAKNAARTFIINNTNSVVNMADLNLVYVQNTGEKEDFNQTEPVFYIYNIKQGNGFIIMSADDAAIPVLGYSNSSGFDGKDMPPAFVNLLDKYKREIIYIKQHELKADVSISRSWKELIKGSVIETRGTSVSPLITTKWNQMPYYNDLCPYDNTYKQRTVTGCAATAMAQIMKFWNYPASGTGFHSYNHNTYGTLSANFGSTTYQWASMPNSVSSTNNAVATLMLHCGISTDMNYGVASTGGSGAYVISAASPVQACVEYALKTYFSYDPATLQGLIRDNYSDATWISKLKTELDNGRPIQYAGFGQGGHTFVCDGYDASSNFHFNWGWAGMYDGYFSIDNLNPGTGGTGGGAGTYNTNQQALIGIKPISGGSNTYTLEIYSSITVTPDPINYANAFSVNVNIVNKGANTYSDSFAAAIFNSSGIFVDFIKRMKPTSLPSGYSYSGGLNFANAGLVAATPGNYFIGIYYKAAGSNWKIVPAGSYNNVAAITVVGPSNDMTLYDSIVPNPKVIVQKQAFTVHTDIANYGTSKFTGDYYLALYDMTGKYVAMIDSFINVTLNASSHYSTGITFSSNGLNVNPGTYVIALWDNDYSTGFNLVASGSFSNPVVVKIISPTLPPDPYEKDNTEDSSYVFTPTFVANSATVETTGSNIHVGNDYDFYKFNLAAGYTYTVNARVHDKYNSGNGNTYTTDVVLAYKTGSGWSDNYDYIVPAPFKVLSGGELKIYVAPYLLGNTGTYLLSVTITRSVSPNITVTSPDSTTDWKKTSTHDITWSDNISDNVIIELFKGTSQIQTISSSHASDGTYSGWTIPGSLVAGNDYRIKITDYADNSIFAYSKHFTISEIISIIDFQKEGEVRIYPNPANHFIQVKTGLTPGQKSSMRIVNLMGKEMMNYSVIDNKSGGMEINVDNLPQGAYYLHLLTRGREIVSPFMIVR